MQISSQQFRSSPAQSTFDDHSADLDGDRRLEALYWEPITVLELSPRPYNALRRAGINTVGQLIERIRAQTLLNVRNIGTRSFDEIMSKLKRSAGADPATLVAATQEACAKPSTDEASLLYSVSAVEGAAAHAREAALAECVTWLRLLVEKHVDLELLHPDVRVGQGTLEEVLHAPAHDAHTQYCRLLRTLASVSIADDIETLTRDISAEQLASVVIPRYGLTRSTLQAVGDSIGITRERVRQIANRIRETIKKRYATLNCESDAPLPDIFTRVSVLSKMQTALLIARDMGASISFAKWKQHLERCGLAGRWSDSARNGTDIIEALVSICQALGDEAPAGLQIPRNLVCAIDLASQGQPDASASDLLVEDLPRKLRRLIAQLSRHSGAVSIRWLCRETGLAPTAMCEMLSMLGYRRVDANWYVLPSAGQATVTKSHVFQRALRKMFQYCGPLEIEQICGGIRKIVHRKQFPVPPPDVMDKVLRLHGCTVEEGMYYWDGPSDEALSRSEQVVFDYLETHHGVVHHDELVRAFAESQRSLQALHYTLRRSPLFYRVEPGIYALRGIVAVPQALQRAREAAVTVPQDLEVNYQDGCIIVALNLGAIAVASGIILVTSNGFPNLSGTWRLVAQGRTRTVRVKGQRIAGLAAAFSELDCQCADRVRLRFDPNPSARTVTVIKAE